MSGSQGLFNRVVAVANSDPYRPAVSDASTNLNYREFVEAARAVGAALRNEYGVARGDLVSVSCGRTVDLPIAIWGLVSAGACVWPVKGEHQSRPVFSNFGPWWALGVPTAAEPLWVREVNRGLNPPNKLVGAIGPDNLDEALYILATSGSTGVPKASAISHRNGLALLSASEKSGLYGAAPETVIWNADPTFDASVQQWLRMARGDSLRVLSTEERLDGECLAAVVAASGKCVLDSTPSHWLAMRDHFSGIELDRLTLLLGGEAIPPFLWDDLKSGGPSSPGRSFNLYGLTEATVNNAMTEIAGDEPTVGSALDGSEVVVLDRELQECPAGIEGDVYVAGAQVGLGYVDPTRCATTFVARPGGDGDRMLRTNDRGARGGGGLVLTGRSDDLIKVRGQWVNTADLSARLSSCPGVRAAVVVHATSARGAGLTAFIVPAAGELSIAPLEAVRSWSRAHLAPHEVPSEFFIRDAIPMTLSGKTNRKELQMENEERGKADSRGIVREELTSSWEAALGTRPGSDVDNFFEAGGHSLSALKFLGQVKKRTGLKISTAFLYENQTFTSVLKELHRQLDQDGPPAESASRASRGAVNIFDDDEVPFLVLVNHEGQHSMWPRTLAVPDGWRPVSSGTRGDCLAYVKNNWADIRPQSSRVSR